MTSPAPPTCWINVYADDGSPTGQRRALPWESRELADKAVKLGRSIGQRPLYRIRARERRQAK